MEDCFPGYRCTYFLLTIDCSQKQHNTCREEHCGAFFGSKLALLKLIRWHFMIQRDNNIDMQLKQSELFRVKKTNILNFYSDLSLTQLHSLQKFFFSEILNSVILFDFLYIFSRVVVIL